MIQQAINEVILGKNLSFNIMKTVMQEIMEGLATQAQMGALLTGLRMKGETVEEITACASVMREKGKKLNTTRKALDIVGTGGDGTGTFNISTTSAIVIAAGGVPVAKHGNRGVSSKSGAADVLECLGVNLNLTPLQSEEIFEKCNICFMFSQLYHNSMKYAAPVRKEMGVRTIFNILGPLSNPAAAKLQLMGVYDRKLVKPLAQVLCNLGVERGVVVAGFDGMDEVTLTSKTEICEITNGRIENYIISPEEYGLKTCSLQELEGGSPAENALIASDILNGREVGAKRDVVLLNSAIGLYLGTNNTTIEACINVARDLIDSGRAADKLLEFKELTRRGFQ